MAIQYRIYGNGGSGPIDYTTPLTTVTAPTLTWTSGALAYPNEWKFGVRTYDSVTTLGERNVDAVLRLKLNASGVDITLIPDAPTGLSGHAKTT